MRHPIILCFGDSNTYGYDPQDFFGGPYAAPWPALLGEALGVPVVNGGQNGRQIPHGSRELLQFRREAARLGAEALVVLLGVNDLLNGVAAAETAARMEAFLTQCGIPNPVLIAPPALRRGAWVPEDRLVSESRELARRLRDLAGQRGLPFADAGEWGLEIAFDGVHFTQQAHADFAKNLAALLREQMRGALT